MKSIVLIASKEFGDRLRSGWVIACVLTWLTVIGLTSFLGLLQIGQIGVQGYERTVVSLLNLAQYLVPLIGLLLGHDLIAGEREQGALRLLLAGGISRWRFVAGKFLGGTLTLALPLALGFLISGSAIRVAAKDHTIAAFLVLAISSLILGILFLGIGMAVSAFSRTRLQALVLALVAWGLAVFVFDLAALGLFVNSKSSQAAREIDIYCDATHVNAAADPHAVYDNAVVGSSHAEQASDASSFGWLALDPVDLFRAVNLSRQFAIPLPLIPAVVSLMLWLALPMAGSIWKFSRTDL